MYRSRSRRDDYDVSPPSSRSGMRAGYVFATTAALVRLERLPLELAQRVTREWLRYINARRQGGKSPESTAAHIARFERLRLARPPARDDGAPPQAVVAMLREAERLRREGRHLESQALTDQARGLAASSARTSRRGTDSNTTVHRRAVSRVANALADEGFDVETSYEGDYGRRRRRR